MTWCTCWSRKRVATIYQRLTVHWRDTKQYHTTYNQGLDTVNILPCSRLTFSTVILYTRLRWCSGQTTRLSPLRFRVRSPVRWTWTQSSCEKSSSQLSAESRGFSPGAPVFSHRESWQCGIGNYGPTVIGSRCCGDPAPVAKLNKIKDVCDVCTNVGALLTIVAYFSYMNSVDTETIKLFNSWDTTAIQYIVVYQYL